jgi:hypothetical protein
MAALAFLAVVAATERAAHPGPVLPEDPGQLPPAGCGAIAPAGTTAEPGSPAPHDIAPDHGL